MLQKLQIKKKVDKFNCSVQADCGQDHEYNGAAVDSGRLNLNR